MNCLYSLSLHSLSLRVPESIRASIRVPYTPQSKSQYLGVTVKTCTINVPSLMMMISDIIN